jgi:hypothetical protein
MSVLDVKFLDESLSVVYDFITANSDSTSVVVKVQNLQLYFGSENDSAGEMLQLTKDNFERSVEISIEDTAPQNENEPGNKGDMRIVESGPGAGYIYIHNGVKWVRSPLETTWNI